MSGALIGIAGAFGGLGGVAINLVLRESYKAHKSATTAFWIFLAFYVVAGVVTWWFYARNERSDRALNPESVDSPAAPVAPTATVTG